MRRQFLVDLNFSFHDVLEAFLEDGVAGVAYQTPICHLALLSFVHLPDFRIRRPLDRPVVHHSVIVTISGGRWPLFLRLVDLQRLKQRLE